METAAQSGEVEIAEELLRFFVDENERECFAALLYTCYELIKPDVALEVSSADLCQICGTTTLASARFWLYGFTKCDLGLCSNAG